MSNCSATDPNACSATPAQHAPDVCPKCASNETRILAQSANPPIDSSLVFSVRPRVVALVDSLTSRPR
jgi:hypothetical protein